MPVNYFFFQICLRNLRIAGVTIKKGASLGMTIKELGEFMYREDPEELSPLE